MAQAPTHVILIGPMGAGKTTIGRALARRLGMPFHDSDDALEQDTATDGATIAETEGVAELHRLEASAVAGLAADPEPSVIAAAASVVDHTEGRSILRSHVTFWLDAAPDILDDRRARSRHRRAVDAAEAGRLRARRAGPLRSVSIARLDTSVEPVDAVVDRLEAMLDAYRDTPGANADIVSQPPPEREQP